MGAFFSTTRESPMPLDILPLCVLQSQSFHFEEFVQFSNRLLDDAAILRR